MQAGGTMVTPGYETQESGGVAMTQGGAGAGGGAGGAGAADGFPHHDQAQFEADKRSVYKHPLFPLLALLFERCEQATQSAECASSDSFNLDIQAFVQHQERDRKPFLLNDPEVDGLMIKAIQVLRIHLLELEKVQELCKDFCNRYITCLKGKMQSENLLRSDYAAAAYEANNNGSGCGSGSGSHSSHSSNSNSPAGAAYPAPPHSPHHMQVVSSAGCVPNQHGGGGGGGGPVLMGPHAAPQAPGGAAAAAAAYQMAAAAAAAAAAAQQVPQQQQQPPPQGPPGQAEPPSPGVVHGGTPLSQIGANPCPPPADGPLGTLHGGPLSPAPTTPGSVDDDDDFLGSKKKQKRGVLPKHATSVMRSWLFQHLVHPYPTEDEKRQIAAQTSLTLLQVNNWFINARRRILQPMLDASAPGGGSAGDGAGGKSPASGSASGASGASKASKGKSGGSHKGTAAAQRFWPESLASLQPQLALGHDATANGTPHTESSLMSSGGALSSEDSEGSSQEDDEEEYDDEEDTGPLAPMAPLPHPPLAGPHAALKLECSSEDSQQ